MKMYEQNTEEYQSGWAPLNIYNAESFVGYWSRLESNRLRTSRSYGKVYLTNHREAHILGIL